MNAELKINLQNLGKNTNLTWLEWGRIHNVRISNITQNHFLTKINLKICIYHKKGVSLQGVTNLIQFITPFVANSTSTTMKVHIQHRSNFITETIKACIHSQIKEKTILEDNTTTMDNNNSLIPIQNAVQDIKVAILQSQERAARDINANQLTLYFSIGRYISENSRIQQWGSNAIATISEQLQKELPGLKGFGVSSIRNMRQFYEEWKNVIFTQSANPQSNIIQQPTAGEITLQNQQPMAGEIQSLTMTNVELAIQVSYLQFSNKFFDIQLAYYFLSISFTHHMEILFKTKTLEERIFYIQKTAEYKWDKYKLRDMLKKELYHHQSLMPNNFLVSMPKHSQALKAIEMFKDEYLLDYINVEELNVRDKSDVDESIVEQEIIHNVKNFIMMFGNDFTFVGNQYHLEKFGENEYVDLLFYNRELACLVAVELKKGKFKPSYLGQLQSYLKILDTEVRKPNENPSIGIILCREANKAYVEFVIQGYESPMGVATYKTAEDMPERLRKALPDVEELKKLIIEDGKNEYAHEH